MRKTLFLPVLLLIILLFCTLPASAALRQGSRGNDVTKVQEKLSAWGYYTGSIDGIYGSQTSSAVKAFQRKNGLTVDGIVGSQTAAAMGITLTQSSTVSSSYDRNVELLARMIAAEGRGEPYKGQVAIGAVIMNRISHPSFPNTLAGVLYQKGAFSAIDDGQFDSTPVPESTRRAAVEAYNGSDPTGGCVYYYNPAKTTNKWIRSLPVYTVIGQHYFCQPE